MAIGWVAWVLVFCSARGADPKRNTQKRDRPQAHLAGNRGRRSLSVLSDPAGKSTPTLPELPLLTRKDTTTEAPPPLSPVETKTPHSDHSFRIPRPNFPLHRRTLILTRRRTSFPLGPQGRRETRGRRVCSWPRCVRGLLGTTGPCFCVCCLVWLRVPPGGKVSWQKNGAHLAETLRGGLLRLFPPFCISLNPLSSSGCRVTGNIFQLCVRNDVSACA